MHSTMKILNYKNNKISLNRILNQYSFLHYLLPEPHDPAKISRFRYPMANAIPLISSRQPISRHRSKNLTQTRATSSSTDWFPIWGSQNCSSNWWQSRSGSYWANWSQLDCCQTCSQPIEHSIRQRQLYWKSCQTYSSRSTVVISLFWHC